MTDREDPVVAALDNYRLRCPEDCGLADEALAVYAALEQELAEANRKLAAKEEESDQENRRTQ